MENKDNSADKNMKKTDSANLQLTKIMEQILQMLQKTPFIWILVMRI